MMLEGLKIDDQRRRIIESNNHCLVLGGPGSGKTTLALLAAQRVINDGLAPGQSVLFLSFSRAAVRRISESIKGTIENENQSALHVHTFHSFFWSILRPYGFLLGAPRELRVMPPHEEIALRHGIQPGSTEWNKWEEKRLDLFTKQGLVCFDLFSPLSQRLLQGAKKLASRLSKRHPLIIVDEVQDTSTDQWQSITLLTNQSRTICLGDLDQLIYDHLPGVGPQRIEDIRAFLNPVEVDLATENNRSSGTEIAIFARDVLNCTFRASSYSGVAKLNYSPQKEHRDQSILRSIAIVNRKVKEFTGRNTESIAFISTNHRGSDLAVDVLKRNQKPFHTPIEDYGVMLASRFGSLLLELKNEGAELTLLNSLDILKTFHLAKGTQTSISRASQIDRWKHEVAAGRLPKVRLVRSLYEIIEICSTTKHSGNPTADIASIRKHLLDSKEPELFEASDSIEALMLQSRGRRIASGLADLWIINQTYRGAREVFEAEILMEQMVGSSEPIRGLHVLNIHKCKGKQFDGVVLFRNEKSCPFIWRNDVNPHLKSRRLLHVAISRAKYYVLVLNDASGKCPILSNYQI